MIMMSALDCTNTISWISYDAISLKQQSMGKPLAKFRHIILNSTQPVCVLTPQCCVLSGDSNQSLYLLANATYVLNEETIHTSLIVFGFT